MQARVTRRKRTSRDARQHHLQRGVPNLLRRLAQGRQRDGQQGRVIRVIDANEPNIFGNAMLQPPQSMHQPPGCAIVGAHDRVGLVRIHQVLHCRLIVGRQATDPSPIDGRVERVERFTISRFALVNGRCPSVRTDKRHAPRAERQQVLRHHVSCTTIVDADEIVTVSVRVRRHPAVEQHDRNTRCVERMAFYWKLLRLIETLPC